MTAQQLREKLMQLRSSDDPLFDSLIDIVCELREALGNVTAFASELCQDIGISSHYPSIERGRKALADTDARLKAMGILP